jgi:hypothetical protein
MTLASAILPTAPKILRTLLGLRVTAAFAGSTLEPPAGMSIPLGEACAGSPGGRWAPSSIVDSLLESDLLASDLVLERGRLSVLASTEFEGFCVLSGAVAGLTVGAIVTVKAGTAARAWGAALIRFEKLPVPMWNSSMAATIPAKKPTSVLLFNSFMATSIGGGFLLVPSF